MRIFWTVARKRKLLEQSETMTVNQMARYHLQPVAEIERLIRHLTQHEKMIMRKYKEGKYTITVYYPAYADGVRSQHVGARAEIW